VLGVHHQPESDWDAYYGPLGERADAADPGAPGMAGAIAATREEIGMRVEHGDEYGYTGYALRPSAWRVRPETAADVAAVHAVHASAFPTEDEARVRLHTGFRFRGRGGLRGAGRGADGTGPGRLR